MISAQEILKAIETADPFDSGGLDEIDASVWCYIHHGSLGEIRSSGFDFIPVAGLPFLKGWEPKIKYTRSRDAIKSIRPSRFWVPLKFLGSGFGFADDRPDEIIQTELLTEELAELHATIQSIEYERNKKAPE